MDMKHTFPYIVNQHDIDRPIPILLGDVYILLLLYILYMMLIVKC